MDRDRFDALTRLLGAQGSRRTALGAVLGTALLGGGISVSAKKGKKGKKKKGKEPKLAGGSCAGKSLLQLMWEELDTVIDRLMSGDGAAEDGKDPGRAEGIAICLSILSQPYYPTIDSIREEAMARYEQRQEGEDTGTEIPAEYV